MKNCTGVTLQWKGQNYLTGEEVPDAIAQEMQLETMPEQIKGLQSASEPEPITDPYDPRAIAVFQAINPPISDQARNIDPILQSNPDVSLETLVTLESPPPPTPPLEDTPESTLDKEDQEEGVPLTETDVSSLPEGTKRISRKQHQQ